MRKTTWRRTLAAIVAVAGIGTSLSACVTNSEQGHPADWQEITPAEVPEIAAMVPEKVAQKGELVVGTNPPYAPFEFKDSQHNIIGAEMDITRAIADVLGLDWRAQQQDFSLILPSLSAGTLDIGASGFTDTPERRENYDFVDFLNAGIQWTQRTGEPVSREHPCGLTVSVQRTTVSETDDLHPLNEKCIAEGKKPMTILSYATSDQAATALVLGKAQAFSADSPVAGWAIARADGKLETTGPMFEAAPYGLALPKDSPLAPAVAAALQHLIETGDYQKILTMWGITDGYITDAQVNAPQE